MRADVSQVAVRVANLHVIRGGVVVIDDLSFEVPTGEVIGLLGPSGCGKSTLMRSMVGVQIVASGTVEVLGLPAGSPVLRDRVGYMSQGTAVYSDLTARENLHYFARILGAPLADVDRVIDVMDLRTHADALVSRMSGGQVARVSLATALLGKPELLILDEPTVGLDPVLRRDLWRLFHDLAAEGSSLLVSSHVMDEASRCERLLLMRNGTFLADETPEGLLRRTGEEDIEAAFLHLTDEPAQR
jgi:ABC-2 type transport system ATP-binding protein